MSMTLVLKVSCRTCNRECGDYKHLMDETVVDNEKTTLAAILNYCTNLDIKANNGSDDQCPATLPEHICNSCVEHLIQAFLFKEMVLETDRNLRAGNTQKEILNLNGSKETEILEANILKTDAEIPTEVITEMVMELPEESISTSSVMGMETDIVVEQTNSPLHNNLSNLEHVSQFTSQDVVLEEEEMEDATNASIIQDGVILMDNAVVIDGTMVDDETDDIIYEMEEWLEMEEQVESVSEQIIETIDGQELGLEPSSYIAQNCSEGNCDTNDYNSDDTLLVEEECDDIALIKTNEGECLIELQESNYIHSDKENSNIEHTLAAIIEDEDISGGNTQEEVLNSEVSNEKKSFSTNATKTDKPAPAKRRSIKDGNLTKEDLICKYCGKEFDKLCRLREHTYMHTGEKPHVCSICGKRSRTKTHHNVHMLTHSDQKRFKCKVCGQDYRTSNSLRVHERKHSGIKPFACQLCEKSFHTAEQRKLHVMLHTGERPHRCDKCGKAYRESHSLRQHLQSHDDKKPFQCEICGKGLTQMSGYKRHMLLHTDKYPYKCDICGRAFRISSNLVTHRRLHLDVLPFQCNLCKRGFTNSTRLKHHMFQHEQGVQFKERKQKPRKRTEQVYIEQKMAKSRVVEIL